MNSTPNPYRNNKQIATWLIACAILLFSMIILGGVTRLTQSGLSIVEWKPITGIIPPLNESEWQIEFEKYKAFPEYQKVNSELDIHGFKSIYLFEYGHRALGRLIGVFFLLPFIYFYIRKKISPSMKPKLIALFILGGLQGVLGWYMVKSGLVDNPRVSQYRLTAHLGLAVVIYSYMLWLIFDLLRGNTAQNSLGKTMTRYSHTVTGILFLMILSGGFVAGTRAGKAFNTFPLMGDSFIPDYLFLMSPFWINFFENTITIQFTHRLLAYLIMLLVAIFAILLLRSKPTAHIKSALFLFLGVLMLQVGLGISTLLLNVPVVIATAHQGGAILLLSTALYLSHRLQNTSRI